jgi:ribulose-5-phosphate 4-epimerase/fuculose-1-phosphate aldolase
MNESDARTEICRIGASLFSRGYVHGTTGNISIRLEDGYLITPTDASLGRLEPEALSLLDAAGTHVCGERPSKTIVLHRRIYDADPAARCVIHTHSRELVAASLAHTGPASEFLPPITPYFVMKVGRVPLIPYFTPGSAEAAELVHTAIIAAKESGAPIRSVMLDRLGPNVWHTSPSSAMATLEELEETAFLWNRTRPSGLAESSINELRERFGAHW